MDHRKLGKVLFLVGILTGAVVAGGVMYYFSVSGLKELLKNREVEIEKLLEQLRGKEELLKKREEEISKLSEQIKYKQEEISKLEELLKKYELPTIMNISWKPTEIVNNKVYDGRVSFVAESKYSPIAEAYLIFTPRIYAHLPKEAFPEESPRGYILTPIDGVFDGNKEEFSVDIMNIKGGREYDITAITVNSLGMMNKGELPTPYIREFENLGKQLYEKGIKIGIIYGLITQNWVWDGYRELGGPYEPLLGYYATNSTRDLIVTERHMDWMSGHGINFILNIWSGMDDRDKFFKEAISTLEIFKNGGMKFGMLYESHWRFIGEPGINMSDPRNIQILKEDLSYLTENYFKHPAYLKIDGKPFFYIYMVAGMFGGTETDPIKDIKSGLDEIYKFMKEKYGIQLYMLSDHAGPDVTAEWAYIKDYVPQYYDALVTGMHASFGWSREKESWEEHLEAGFKYWYNFSLSNRLDYIPFLRPGLSAKYCPWAPPEARESDPFAYPRSIELWKKRIEIGVPYSNTFGMMVGDFNDVFENGVIEPTVQEGFEYLKAMREVLTKYYLKSE